MERAPFAFSPPGRNVARYRLTQAEAEAAFGPPHYAPGGPRHFPTWGLRTACGLELEVQLDVARAMALLHTELRELEHALRHLDVDDRIVWRMDSDREAFERALEEYHPVAWGRWTVALRGPTGALEPVARCLSPGDARCRADALVAEGQPALVEEEPTSRARERRAQLTLQRPAKRSRARERWEVWWLGPDGAQTLLHLAPSRDEADAFCRSRAQGGPGEWQIRPR